jgi:pilus assembly protein CpaE
MEGFERPIMIAHQGSRFERIRAKFAALLRYEDGVSAIEFALFAPILFVGFLMMADLAFAAYQRMTIDHILRFGAQRAMADPSTDPAAPEVLRILQLTAAENFSVESSTPIAGKPPLTLSAERYCACPEDTSVKVTCSTICASTKPTLAYYSLSATRVYSGMIIPQMTFRPEIQVQVR